VRKRRCTGEWIVFEHQHAFGKFEAASLSSRARRSGRAGSPARVPGADVDGRALRRTAEQARVLERIVTVVFGITALLRVRSQINRLEQRAGAAPGPFARLGESSLEARAELEPSRTPSSGIGATNSETVGSQSHSLHRPPCPNFCAEDVRLLRQCRRCPDTQRLRSLTRSSHEENSPRF